MDSDNNSGGAYRSSWWAYLLAKVLGPPYRVLVAERRWFAILSASINDFIEKKLYYYSCSFTYNAFLAVIALLAALSAVIGILSRVSADVELQMVRFLRTIVPLTGTSAEGSLTAMRDYSSLVGIVGFVVLIWTSTRLFRATEVGISVIWGTGKRGYIRSKLYGALSVSIIGVLFIAAFLVQFGFMSFWGWLVGEGTFLYSVGTFFGKPLVGLIASYLLFLFVYKLVPSVPQGWKQIRVGAAVTGIAYLILLYGIDLYYGSISRVPVTYGALSTAFILIIWVHLLGIVIFMGEEIIFVSQHEEMIEECRKRACGGRLLSYLETGPFDEE